ncbi:phosphatidylinositol N-acetylglucosaminyltransferase subunit Q-like [Ornithodoros turicata]
MSDKSGQCRGSFNDMVTSSVNVFLPIQLCSGTGLLLAGKGETESDIICAAVIRLGDDQLVNFIDVSALSARARKSFDRVGLLVVKHEPHLPDEVSAVPLDFVIHLNWEVHVLTSLVRGPERDAVVIFYDAVKVENLHEGQAREMVATSNMNTHSLNDLKEDVMKAVPADCHHKPRGCWLIVLLVATAMCKIRDCLAIPGCVSDTSRKVMRTSMTGTLVCNRLRGLADVKKDFEQHGRVTLASKNLVTGLLLDCLLGLVFVLGVKWYGPLPWASLRWAQTVVTNLRTIVQWLMGAPAGLKLNAQLSSALGRFFLYHINLWETYVSVVWPWVSPLLYVRVGSLGLQLSLASDLLSLATLHVYCFYGYAGRLYWAWAKALGALGRQWRARKWNPLRQRTDTYRCTTSEHLFLSTVLFVILLFLFPTVAVFYAVFLALRVAVLAVQSVLQRTLELWDAMPWYTIFSRLLGQGPVVGEAHFEVVTGGTKSALYMKVVPTALSLGPFPSPAPNWKSLVTDMLLGNILYPL